MQWKHKTVRQRKKIFTVRYESVPLTGNLGESQESQLLDHMGPVR